MGKKINFNKIYEDLSGTFFRIKNNKKFKSIGGVQITLGKKPPRIYISFLDLSSKLGSIREDLSSEGKREHEKIFLEFTDRASEVLEIMKGYGLISHKSYDPFTKRYGYKHDYYKMN